MSKDNDIVQNKKISDLFISWEVSIKLYEYQLKVLSEAKQAMDIAEENLAKSILAAWRQEENKHD